MIGAPPFQLGAVQMIVEDELALDEATTFVGAPGAVAGVAAADAFDAGEVPDTFVAVTLNVYEVPLRRPMTTHGLVRPQETAVCAEVPTNGVTV